MAPEPPPPERIVLVVIDTLRADHLGSYGYRRPVSPFLDSLAERGVVFSRAYAQSSTTQPSHASLFTSLYPLQHNVHRNGFRLDESYVTLAELLARQGFATAAFTSTDAHFDWGGLRQGFEHYDELAQDGSTKHDTKRKPDDKLYRPANETIDSAIRWLDAVSPDQRFFLWVHLFDPHGPRDPPAEYLQKLRPKNVAERLAQIEFLKTEHRLDTSRNGALRRQILLYDGEIAFVDAELRRLYSELARRGLDNGALWVPIQGQSLVPLMRGAIGGYTKRYAFAQRSLYPQRRQLRLESMTKGQNYALQTLDSKYLLYTDGDDEFYDLARDPYETRNRIDRASREKDELRTALEELIEALGSERAPLPVDSQAIERLRALGYLQ